MRPCAIIAFLAAITLLGAATVTREGTAVAATGVGGGGTGIGPVTGPAAEGRKLWLSLNCSGCHGNRDEGGMGPRVEGDAGDVGEAVLQGKGEGMPSYSGRVTNAQIGYLSAYLRSIGTAGEPRFTHWWEATPSR